MDKSIIEGIGTHNREIQHTQSTYNKEGIQKKSVELSTESKRNDHKLILLENDINSIKVHENELERMQEFQDDDTTSDTDVGESEELDTPSQRLIKDESIDDAGVSADGNNLDTEAIQYLQGRNGANYLNDSSRQTISVKPEPGAEVPSVSSDAKLVYRCKYCGQQLQKLASLLRHEEAHRNGTIYKCRFCEYYTLERTRIASHECKHTGEKPYACDICDFRCASKCDLSKHNKVHVTDRPYQCKLCSHTSKSSNNLQKHMRVHSDYRPYGCDSCDQKFKTKCALENHRMLHSDSVHFFCDKCDYTCKTPNLLRQHAISHSEVRNFPCTFPDCLQRCKTKSDLVKHMSVHQTGLDFKCVLCNKLFKSLHSLRSHTRRHEKREYPCQVCGKVLTSTNSRRHHMLALHLDGKKIDCLICGNKFSSKDNLKNHIKVHESDRSFRCPLCLHGFKDVNHLFTHIGAFHGKDYVYVCDICHRPFSRYMMMKFHIDRNHLNEKDKNVVHEFVYDKSCSSYDAKELDSKLRVMNEWLKGNKIIADSSLTLEDVKPDLELTFSLNGLPKLEEICNSIHESSPFQNQEAASSLFNPVLSSNNLEHENVATSSQVSQTCNVENPAGSGNLPDVQENHDVTSNSADPAIASSDGLGNKSSSVKLERLDDGNVLSGKSSVEHVNRLQQNSTKVIKLGSYANVSINLTGKDAGVKFNMKKGKKCKGWFTHPDNLLPEAREKTISYLVKQASFIPKKGRVKRNVKKRGRPPKMSQEPIDIVSKKVSHKSKGKKRNDFDLGKKRNDFDLGKKRKDSVSRKLKGDINPLRRIKSALNSMSESTSEIKIEVEDTTYGMAEQNLSQNLPHQPESHELRNGIGERVCDQTCNETTNNVQFHAETRVEHNGNNTETPNIVESPSGSQVEITKDSNHNLSADRRKEKSKKFAVEKKKRQMSVVSGKKSKSVNSSNSNDLSYTSDEKRFPSFPKLRIVIPNILKNGSLTNKQMAKSKKGPANTEPSAVVGVEDVIDSPLQVTWKKVGGHKDNRSYKMHFTQSQSMIPKSSTGFSEHHDNINVKKDKEGEDILLNGNCESVTPETNDSDHHSGFSNAHLNSGLLNANEIKEGVHTSAKSYPAQFGNSSSVSEKTSSFQSTLSSLTETNSDLPVTGEASTSSANPNVKVISLKEFEDEYRKRPKVVANVSLNQSQMKPVVELDDILRKRKGGALEGKSKKKRLMMKISMKNLALEVTEDSTIVPSNLVPPCHENERQEIFHSENSESVLSSVGEDVSLNNGNDYNDNEVLHGDVDNTIEDNHMTLKKIPVKNVYKVPKNCKSEKKHALKSQRKNITKKCDQKISINGKHLFSKISIVLEKCDAKDDVVMDSNSDLNCSNSVLSTRVENSEIGTIDTQPESHKVVQADGFHEQNHKSRKEDEVKTPNNLFKGALSHKSPNRKLKKNLIENEDKIENKKTSSSKQILKKKVAVRNKIKMSALLGKNLGRKKSHLHDDRETNFSKPENEDLHQGESRVTTSDSQMIKTPTGLSKPKEIRKKCGLKMSLKLNSKESPYWKVQKKEVKKNKGLCGLKKVKTKGTLKSKLNGHEKSVSFSKKGSFNTIENRIKLPGLMSTDTTERRLTVECVTLSPRVLLKNMTSCFDYCNSQQDVQGTENNSGQDVPASSTGTSTGIENASHFQNVHSVKSLVKIETDSGIEGESNVTEKNMDMSLSLGLYNNCVRGSGNYAEVLGNTGLSQCSDAGSSHCSIDLSKQKELQSNITELSVTDNAILCDTSVMNEGYLNSNSEEQKDIEIEDNLPCAKNDVSNIVDDVTQAIINSYAISDTTVMCDDYTDSIKTDVFQTVEISSSDVVAVTMNEDPECLPFPPRADAPVKNSGEIVCTEELTDCDENKLTVVVEL